MHTLGKAAFLLLACAAPLAGCQQAGPSNQPPEPEFIEPRKLVTVSGFAWDPEAFEYSFLSCGDYNCPDWAVGMVSFKHFDRSVVTGAEVMLFDTKEAKPGFPAAGPSVQKGVWYIKDVPRRYDPFLPIALKPAGGGAAEDFGLPQANTYFPTLSLRPIVPISWQCIGQEAPLISDRGILQAVAHHLTAEGSSTVPADLVNPARFGGVVIWRNLMPGLGNWAGAPGSTMEASAGRVINVQWAPPGTPMSAGVTQSDRGYFVEPGAPVSGIGLTVTLFDPLTGPPPSVTFRSVDPVTDAQFGRPWKYQELPPLVVAPGSVYFGQMMVAPDKWEFPHHPEYYMCLPPEH